MTNIQPDLDANLVPPARLQAPVDTNEPSGPANKFYNHPSKLDMLSRCLFHAGPASTTLTQRGTSISSLPVCVKTGGA